jgi:hypothetical protein
MAKRPKSTTKEEVSALLDTLPDDCSLEDIQYRLYVLEKVQLGLEDTGQSGAIPQAGAEPIKKIDLASSDVPSLLVIVFKFGDWLMILLQVFIIINTAIVGWILTTKPYWTARQKATVIVIYSSAMFINLVWMARLHEWLKMLLNNVQSVVRGTNLESKSEFIIKRVFQKPWWYMLFGLHIVSHAAVILCILFWTNNQK